MVYPFRKHKISLLITSLFLPVAPALLAGTSVVHDGNDNQVWHEDGTLNISGGYYEVASLQGDVDLSFTGGDINATGSGRTDAVRASAATGMTFSADGLSTQGGGVSISSGGLVSVAMNNTEVQSASLQTTDAVWISQTGAGNSLISVSDSSFDNRFDVSSQGDDVLNVTGTVFADGVRVFVSGVGSSASVALSDSTLAGVDNDPLNVQSSSGAANVQLDNVIVINEGGGYDVQIISAGDASLAMTDSRMQSEALVYSSGGSATARLTGSMVGGAPTPDGYVVEALVAAGAPASGVATVSVEGGTVNGSVTAQSWNNSISSVSLSDNAVVNGNARLVGADMVMNIDDASLKGNIKTSAYGSSTADSTTAVINLSHTTYRGNITSADTGIPAGLTVNVNDGAITGGESLDTAMRITGYSSVNFNINYLDASLIDTGKVSWFYVNNDEHVLVNSSLANGTLAPLRSGSFIRDDIRYQATDESVNTADAQEGRTYGVIFYTDAPVPPPTPPTPTPPTPPTPTPPTPPTPVPPPVPETLVADLQSAQAGLLASDDMIHLVAGGITRQLDTFWQSRDDSHFWLQGIYNSGNRDAGQARYSNNITGAVMGGDTGGVTRQGDSVSFGLSFACLNNNLNLRDQQGGNDIDGAYYSLYARWQQPVSADLGREWFADMVFTTGDLHYESQGQNGALSAGGSYNGRSWLWQTRAGVRIRQPEAYWLQPYLTAGYDVVRTDSYSDGYSHVSGGKQEGGFAGTGLRAGVTRTLKNGVRLEPYMELGYAGQFSSHTTFKTEDYSFEGQRLNGGNAGTGLEAQFTPAWSASASISTAFGHDIRHEVNGIVGMKYRF